MLSHDSTGAKDARTWLANVRLSRGASPPLGEITGNVPEIDLLNFTRTPRSCGPGGAAAAVLRMAEPKLSGLNVPSRTQWIPSRASGDCSGQDINGQIGGVHPVERDESLL